MNEIKEKIHAISKKIGGGYTSFSYTINGDGTFTWNVYTPILGHNNYKSKEELVRFLDAVLDNSLDDENSKLAYLIEQKRKASENLVQISAEIENEKKRYAVGE